MATFYIKIGRFDVLRAALPAAIPLLRSSGLRAFAVYLRWCARVLVRGLT